MLCYFNIFRNRSGLNTPQFFSPLDRFSEGEIQTLFPLTSLQLDIFRPGGPENVKVKYRVKT